MEKYKQILSESNYNMLLKSGMFYEFYPELSGVRSDDLLIIAPIKPTQLEEIDLTKLRAMCQEYIDLVDDDDGYYEDNDYDAFIFERAMEAIFGDNVWKFINNRRK